MDMWDGMEPKLNDNMPQMIFAEDRGEVLQVRKQDLCLFPGDLTHRAGKHHVPIDA